MNRWWSFVLFFALFACGNNKKEAKTLPADSLNITKIIQQEDSVLISTTASAWLREQLKVSAWQWSNLELENYWQDEAIAAQPYTLTPEFLRDYKTVLRWAPDSSILLDIGSYGSVVVTKEDGTTRLEGGEPDTEISVIFPRENKKARLLFAGPSSYIINATWLSNTEAIIAGTFDAEGNQERDTLLWLVDVKQNQFRLYNYKQHR